MFVYSSLSRGKVQSTLIAQLCRLFVGKDKQLTKLRYGYSIIILKHTFITIGGRPLLLSSKASLFRTSIEHAFEIDSMPSS